MIAKESVGEARILLAERKNRRINDEVLFRFFSISASKIGRKDNELNHWDKDINLRVGYGNGQKKTRPERPG